MQVSLFRLPHIRIVMIYIVIASLWILFSDSAVLLFVHLFQIDEDTLTRLSMVKGIAFVFTTGSILYMLLRQEFHHKGRLERDLREQIQQVERSEQRFRKAVEEAPLPMVIHANDGEILIVNKRWLEITGYTHEQLTTVQSWLHLAYGDRKEEVEAIVGNLFDEAKRVDSGESVIQCADGTQRVWEFSTTPLGRLPDQRRIAISMAADVTERKQTENQLRVKESAIETSITPMALADIEGNVTYLNPAFIEMWKLKSTQDIMGRPIINGWVSPEEAQKVITSLFEQDNYIGELQAKIADGTTADVELTASLVRDTEGHPICIMGSFKDITKQKHADAFALENERLKVNFQKEQERNAFVMRIISALSHDLRTPLTVISSSRQLLMKYGNRMPLEAQQRKLDGIGRQVQFALDLLEDTVNMARGHLDEAPLQPTPVNIAALCQVSVNELQETDPIHHPLEFVNNLDTKTVVLDEVLVSRILMNLLSNAVKYSPNATPVRLELDQEAEWLVLRILDQGLGIKQEELKHIFDPFYRSDAVSRIQGTGLGLSIVQDCVQRHCGEIEVESQVDAGSTFTVKLPLEHPEIALPASSRTR